MEAVGTPRLEFSLSYRVTFLSRMYYTTGVSKRTFGIFFFYLTQLLINRSAANLSNISVFLTYFNFLYTLETNLWFIHVVSFPCFPGGTFALSFSSYLAVWQCWIFVVVLPSVHGSGWQRIIPILSCPLCVVLMLLCVCTWKTGRVKGVNKLIIVYDIINSLLSVNLSLHLRNWLLLYLVFKEVYLAEVSEYHC